MRLDRNGDIRWLQPEQGGGVSIGGDYLGKAHHLVQRLHILQVPPLGAVGGQDTGGVHQRQVVLNGQLNLTRRVDLTRKSKQMLSKESARKFPITIL